MQRLDRRDLRFGQALVAALARRAAQRFRLEFRLAADRVLNQLIVRAVGLVARLQHRLRDEFDLGGPDPAFAHRRQARARAGMLQSDPVDDGHTRKDAVKVIRVALRHRQRLAAALRRSHEIQFRRRIAVGAHHQDDGSIPHALVGSIGKILEGLVVERKRLRRFARLGFVAGIRAVGDKAARQRRRRTERIGRRQSKAGDQHAVEAAAAILQRAAVPLDREIDLEFDRRRIGIGRRDLAEHLAEFRIGRRDPRRRRRPSSATASGVGATMEAELIRTTLSVGRMRSPQVAAGSPAIFAAIASARRARSRRASAANGAHARMSNLRRCIVSPNTIVLQPR